MVAWSVSSLPVALWLAAAPAWAGTPYLQPPKEILEVLNAPEIPVTDPSPGGQWLLLVTPVRYPPLADRAAPMFPLAGVRVDPRTNGLHTPSLETAPVLQRVTDGTQLPLALPEGVDVLNTIWSADSQRLVIVTRADDHVGLWVADVLGHLLWRSPSSC